MANNTSRATDDILRTLPKRRAPLSPSMHQPLQYGYTRRSTKYKAAKAYLQETISCRIIDNRADYRLGYSGLRLTWWTKN
eukprot:scaffold3084_cov144-Cylindrotheca_fusiformis.AAC.9